jgi:molecular chaperone DnaJ
MSEQEWLDKDYYKTLGVDKSASADEIKKAYRKLARKLHPDQNKNNPQAEEQFKNVTAAYEVLSKPEERKRYDAFRQMGRGGARFSGGFGGTNASAGGFEDIFSMFGGASGGGTSGVRFGSGARGSEGASFSNLGDIFSMFGGGRMGSNAGFGASAGGPSGPGGFAGGSGPEYVYSQDPRAAGQAGSHVYAKPIELKTSITFDEAVKGKIVTVKVAGSEVKAKIPAGINDGQTIKINHKGREVHIKVAVKKHPFFELDGLNVVLHLPIKFDEAVFGAEIKVPTVDQSEITIKVAPFSKNGSKLRVKGKGIKKQAKTEVKQGDMIVVLEVVTPEKLTKKAEKALKEFENATKNNDPRTGLFD